MPRMCGKSAAPFQHNPLIPENWYFQYHDVDSRVRQIYLGPKDERLDRLAAGVDMLVREVPSITEKLREMFSVVL